MNHYTPKQLKEIFTIMINDSKYPSFAIKLFISNNFDFLVDNLKICEEDHAIYNRMKNFRWKKVTGNIPTKEQKHKMKRLINIIFEAKLKDVPLFINDDMVGSIVRWRLVNRI